MNNDNQFSNLIYEFFLMRFRLQYYNYGDTLPSIDMLCREFSVSPQTVKTALRRLRAEGFIDMHNGRSTRVLFQQTKEGLHETALEYFSVRQSAYSDLFKTSEMIFTPLLVEGFRRISQEELEGLSLYVQGGRADDVLKFFCYVLQKLENPLAMNLYWETSMFLGLLFIGEKLIANLPSPLEIYEEFKKILSSGQKQDWSHLSDAIVRYQRGSTEVALECISRYLPSAREQDQIPFTWRIYYERPQVCYSLSMRLLHEIYIGEYREEKYLPSYEKMAAKYNVSVSTVRRMIRVVTQMGALEPVNGVGIRILSVGESQSTPDFTSPAVRRNVALFFQAFELLIYSSEKVVPATFREAAPGSVEGVISQLKENQNSDRCEFSLWHLLIFLAQFSPLRGVREIFGKIYGLFLWGYPLKISHKNTREYGQEDERFTKSMLGFLEKADFEKAAACFKELVTQQFKVAEQYMFKNGMHPDELRISPSIRLILE